MRWIFFFIFVFLLTKSRWKRKIEISMYAWTCICICGLCGTPKRSAYFDSLCSNFNSFLFFNCYFVNKTKIQWLLMGSIYEYSLIYKMLYISIGRPMCREWPFIFSHMIELSSCAFEPIEKWNEIWIRWRIEITIKIRCIVVSAPVILLQLKWLLAPSTDQWDQCK